MSTVVQADRRAPAPWRDQVGALGRHVGVPVAAAIVVLTAITVGVGSLILRQPDAGIGALDLSISRQLATHRTPLIDGITGVGVSLADSVPVALVWIAAMVVAGVVTRRWTIPVFLVAVVGGEKLTYLLAGGIVGRTRPPVPPLGDVFSSSSFPSGHAGAAVALYGGLVVAVLWYVGLRRRRRVAVRVQVALAIGVVVVAGLVAFSRVWRGQHYPSDVIGGLALGGVWLALGWWLVLRPVRGDDGEAGPAAATRATVRADR